MRDGLGLVLGVPRKGHWGELAGARDGAGAPGRGRKGEAGGGRYWKFKCCKSIVQSALVKKSRSSSEKWTGLSREPWRLGESPSESCRQDSAEKMLSSGNKGESWLSG